MIANVFYEQAEHIDDRLEQTAGFFSVDFDDTEEHAALEAREAVIVALSKAILLSLCAVFLLMPGVIMLFSNLMEKTKHKNFIPDFPQPYGTEQGDLDQQLLRDVEQATAENNDKITTDASDNLESAGNQAKNIFDTLNDMPDIALPQLGEDYRSKTNSLTANPQGLPENIGYLNGEMASTNDILIGDLEDINDQFSAIIEDARMNSTFLTKCVLCQNINQGKITAQKSCAGGIAGLQEINETRLLRWLGYQGFKQSAV